MISKRKIVLIIPSLKVGGMERVMSTLANFFCEMEGLEVHLILTGHQKKFYSINEKIILHEPKFENENKLLYSIKTLFFLRNHLKKINAFSLLSFGEKYNSFVLLASLGLNVKKYVSDRSKPDKNWGPFHNQLRRILYPSADGIISQTQYAKNFIFNSLKHGNVCVIPNPLSERKFQTYGNKKNIILTVGRLIKTKNIEFLVKTFSKIKHAGWELWIVGSGPEKVRLDSLIREKKLSNKIKMLGDQVDVGKFYMQAKIFAFASTSEGFPNVLLEAMETGLPCVSFDCIAGPSEVIQNNRNGFLIPLGDEDLYESKLEQLIKDTSLRQAMSHEALCSVKKFNINTIGPQYLNILLK